MKIFDVLYAISWALFIVIGIFTRDAIVTFVLFIITVSMMLIDEWKSNKKIKDIEKKWENKDE